MNLLSILLGNNKQPYDELEVFATIVSTVSTRAEKETETRATRINDIMVMTKKKSSSRWATIKSLWRKNCERRIQLTGWLLWSKFFAPANGGNL